MVIVEQFRISDDGKMMYLDVHVNKADYFTNIYLDHIIISTSNQVSEADPLSPGNEYVYRYDAGEADKEAHLALFPANFNEHYTKSDFSGDLFFAYIVCKGSVGECTPCRLDELTTLAVTFDYNLFYQRVMGYTRELANSCEIPSGFMDMILNFNALKAAIDTEHYVPAIGFYEQMLGLGNAHRSITSGGTFNSGRGCGCRG